MTLNIGFIGPGIMGRPMALNLLKHGYSVSAYARKPDALRALVEAGATACNTPAEAATRVDIVITMVSDTPDVEQVLFGENGVFHGAMRGCIVVDMSTISPVATRSFAKRLESFGIEMLDAPVSGGEIGAINGSLSIMAGGKQEIFDKIRPVLECLGQSIILIGESGAGQVAKACNQIVAGITIEAVAEAITFAQRNGVDAAKVRTALLGGFAGSKILEVHGQRMLDLDFKPGFKVALHHKDMRIVMETARQLGLSLPAAELVTQHLNTLMEHGDAELDSSAIYTVV